MSDKEYLLRLSWPHKDLSSNSRAHWAKKAKAVKAYRLEAFAEGKLHQVAKYPNAVLEFHYCPPDRHSRDLHNMAWPMKPVIDGIADAMGCDDNKFRCVEPDDFDKTVKGGCVLVHVKPGAV